MKKSKVQQKFLEELERNPIVQHACERCGISRNTYYRWIKEDKDFKYLCEESKYRGIDLVNDVAESNVLKGIKNNDPGMTKYWLSSRHPQYRKPFWMYNQIVKEEKTKSTEEAERLAEEMKQFRKRWLN